MVDSAIAGLAGVALGTAGALLGARMSIRSAERLARLNTRDQHVQTTREKAAEAYVAAIEAVQWISNHHAEDSVSPHFAEAYRPRTEAALVRLREARRAVSHVAASGVAGDLPALALQTEGALAVLDDSWHQVQEYAVNSSSAGDASKMGEFYKRIFNDNYDRLLASRLALTGFDGSTANREEIDLGTVLPGSLLAKLRDATLSLD